MKEVKTLWMAVVLTGMVMGPAFAGADEGVGAPVTPPAGPASMGERKPFRGGLAPRNEGLAAELGLSQDKAKEIKNRMHETRKTMIKLKADRDVAKADLEHLLTADTLDEKAIMEAADKLAQINADMTKAQVKAYLAVSSTLTPEQRARMHELRQGMMQRFKERGEGGRERRIERRGDRSGQEPEPEDKPF